MPQQPHHIATDPDFEDAWFARAPPPPNSVISGNTVTGAWQESASDINSYIRQGPGEMIERPDDGYGSDDRFDAASFRNNKFRTDIEMKVKNHGVSASELVDGPQRKVAAYEAPRIFYSSPKIHGRDQKAFGECSPAPSFPSKLSGEEWGPFPRSQWAESNMSAGQGMARPKLSLNGTQNSQYCDRVRHQAKIGWDEQSAIDPESIDGRCFDDDFCGRVPSYMPGNYYGGLSGGSLSRTPAELYEMRGDTQGCRCGHPEKTGSHGQIRCQYVESTDRVLIHDQNRKFEILRAEDPSHSRDDMISTSINNSQRSAGSGSLYISHHNTDRSSGWYQGKRHDCGDLDREASDEDSVSGDADAVWKTGSRSPSSCGWSAGKSSNSCACDGGNSFFNHASPSWSYASDDEVPADHTESQRSGHGGSNEFSTSGRTAARQKSGTQSDTKILNGATSGLTNEVDFLRQCLIEGAKSQDDHYKALGILSVVQGGDARLRTVSKGRLDGSASSAPLAPAQVPATNDVNAAFARHRLETSMQETVKQLNKMNVYNKLRRQRHTDEKLTRTEAKLSASKGCCCEKHVVKQGLGEQELEKLMNRVQNKKRSYFGVNKVDNRQNAVEDKLDALANDVKKLNSIFQSNNTSKKPVLDNQEDSGALNTPPFSGPNIKGATRWCDVQDTMSKDCGRWSDTGKTASQTSTLAGDWSNPRRAWGEWGPSTINSQNHGLGIYDEYEIVLPHSVNESVSNSTWGTSSVIETPPESNEGWGAGAKTPSQTSVAGRGADSIFSASNDYGGWGAGSVNACRCDELGGCNLHRDAGGTPSASLISSVEYCGARGIQQQTRASMPSRLNIPMPFPEPIGTAALADNYRASMQASNTIRQYRPPSHSVTHE